MNKNNLGYILALLYILTLSTESIFTKLVYSTGINVMSTLSIRYTICSISILLVVFFMRESIFIAKENIPAVSFIICVFILLNYFLCKAFELIPASLAVLLLYTYPTITAILAHYLNKDYLTREKICALIVSILGLVLLLWGAWSKANMQGILFALGASIFNALYFIFFEKTVQKVKKVSCITWLFISTMLIYSSVTLISGQWVVKISFSGWVYFLGLSIFATVLPTTIFLYCLNLIGAARLSFFSTMQPILTAILGYLIFKEKLNAVQFGGAFLIIVAVFTPNIIGYIMRYFKLSRNQA